jgi:hypothetical protein
MPNRSYPNVYWAGRGFWHYSEDKLLGAKPNIMREVRIRRDRGDPL